MSQYRDRLRKLVKQDLPSLRNDFNQGANPLALHACCLRLFKMVELVIYDVLTSGEPEPTASPAAPPPSPPVLAPQPSASLPDLPELPPLDAPATLGNSVQVAGMPPVDLVPGAMNVVVTPTGPVEVGPNGAVKPIPPTA